MTQFTQRRFLHLAVLILGEAGDRVDIFETRDVLWPNAGAVDPLPVEAAPSPEVAELLPEASRLQLAQGVALD